MVMSNMEFLGICCIACVVPTVVLGIFFLTVGFFFFYMPKLFGYIYSKICHFGKFVKILCIQLIKIINDFYCRVTRFISKTYEKCKKNIGELLEKIKIKLNDCKEKILARKKYYGKIAVLTFVLLASIVIQILIEFDKLPWLIYVDDLNSISIAVVTIQATLFTLVIALLALVTNNDKIYFGFEIKDFYFKHCTVFLEQKTMMFFGIGLILLNTMFLYFDLHNMIYAVFLISLWFIVESARNVMRIFAGTDEVYKKDVEKHIDECLEKDKDVEIICENFANDWNKKISYQDKSIDELYHQIYCKIYMHIIRKSW